MILIQQLLLFGIGRLQHSCCNASSVNTSPNTTRPLLPPWKSSTTASKADRCCLAVDDCHAEKRCPSATLTQIRMKEDLR